jgi:hypothetical protein
MTETKAPLSAVFAQSNGSTAILPEELKPKFYNDNLSEMELDFNSYF